MCARMHACLFVSRISYCTSKRGACQCTCASMSHSQVFAAKMRNAASVAFMPVDARAAGSGATRVLAAALLLSCSQIEYLMAA